MAVYDRVSGMDSEYNFPPEVRRAMAASSEVINQIETEIGNDPTIHAAVLQAIEDALAAGNVSFDKGHLLSSDNVNTLVSGLYRVNATNSALQAVGLPARLGNLYNSQHGQDGFTQLFISAATSMYGPEIWVRASNGIGGLDKPNFEQIYPPVRETRTLGVALNHSRGTGDLETARLITTRYPVRFAKKVYGLRVGFRNFDHRAGQSYPGSFTILGVAVGKHLLAADGSLTGQFDGEPTILRSQWESPEDASTTSTPWMDYVFEPNVEYLISYGIEVPEGQLIHRTSGFGWVNLTIANAWVRSGSITAIPRTFTPLAVHLELRVDKDTPVYAYVGDSQLAAIGTARPRYDSWADKHAFDNGAIAQVYAWPGSRLNEWDDPNDAIYRRFEHLDAPDRLYVHLGTNDLADSSISLGTMQARFEAMATAAKSKTSNNFYTLTTFPRLESSVDLSTREAYNDWMLTTLPGGALEAINVYHPLLEANGKRLDSRWATAPNDGHLTTAGNAQVARIVSGGATPVTESLVIDTSVGKAIYAKDPSTSGLVLIAGDTGVRDLANLMDVPIWSHPSSSDAAAWIVRSGNVVSLALSNLSYSGTETGTVTLLTLPSGFRPPFNIYARTFRGLNAVFQTTGAVRIYSPSLTVDYVNFEFVVPFSWPTSLPGTPK